MTARLILCDLDGTLLRPGHPMSQATLDTMVALRAQGDIVAVASGRSLFAGRNIIRPDTPVDYWIFSTGAGVAEWPSATVIHRNELAPQDTAHIAQVLLEAHEDFMLQAPVPENHRFVYHGGNSRDTDFQKRCEVYRDVCRPFRPEDVNQPASQFIAILPPDEDRLDFLRGKLPEYNVIRATSPMDNHSVWLEIFNRNAGKGNAARWLAEQYLPTHGKAISRVYAIGNDYNDLEMLEYAHEAILANTAPPDLQARYPVTREDTDGAFTEAVHRWGLL